MLLHAADAFDRQVGITIKVVTKALPPILLVFMSAIGGFVLAAVLLPMLSLGSPSSDQKESGMKQSTKPVPNAAARIDVRSPWSK